ncbi:hypothetical protein L2E82_11598 [Cichorium intybus]|uniref:Uncharacterized protein n=1 Tax=Cichorium intybus TaxID=13427 RepID=A0ACB9GEW8_CICIN|nr:hypothetical protein L2E82_11598 [Cichorium intybus]
MCKNVFLSLGHVLLSCMHSFCFKIWIWSVWVDAMRLMKNLAFFVPRNIAGQGFANDFFENVCKSEANRDPRGVSE